MDELLERLKKYHEEMGISYKIISRDINISIGVMYNYTSGIRGLKDAVRQRLNDYLKERGY